MEKPITMVMKEFKEKLASEIRTSNLPAWVVRDIFKDFTLQLERLSAEEEKRAEEAYLKEANNE